MQSWDLRMKRLTWTTALSISTALALMSGCTTDIDEDAYRAGAIQISIDEVTSDELYPTAGDEIDWKMLFVPTPGDITVNTFWDQPLEIFNVEIGIYDRFGIPIIVQRRDSGGMTGEVKSFVPESGLHYIKLSAESGRSIYSVNVKFVSNYDGFLAPTQAPDYVTDLYDDEKTANDTKNNAPADDAPQVPPPGAGVVLPTAGEGGAVLPLTASGGIASAGAAEQTGPRVVRPSSGGGSNFSPAEVRTIDNNSGAVSTDKKAPKAIVSDIKGKFISIDADILGITPLKSGTKIKLNVGRKDGVKNGAIGEIYVDGKILEGGRFKIDSIQEKNCIALTNASPADVKKAKRFVVKVPE